jgi:type IX secretion system PorP/SprF family membrane protein
MFDLDNRRMKVLIPLLLAAFYLQRLQAQDPVFSQFYAAPLQLNPAFAGSGSDPRMGTVYRHQWPGLNQAYRTYNAYYEQPLAHLNSGVGIQIEGDDAGNGLLKGTRVSALYAYNLPVGKEFMIKLGVEAGIRQSAINWSRLVFPDQLDPVLGNVLQSGELPPDRTSRTAFDASAGMLLLSKRAWFGAALKHLNTPNESFLMINNNLNSGLPVRYTVHAGAEIVVKESNKGKSEAFVSPNVLFTSQGPFQQFNAGVYGSLGPIFSGVWYRHTIGNADAIILGAGVREGIFRLGFSYDLTLSELSGRTGGAYEVSLGLLFDQPESARRRKKQADWSDCLNMFR